MNQGYVYIRSFIEKLFLLKAQTLKKIAAFYVCIGTFN